MKQDMRHSTTYQMTQNTMQKTQQQTKQDLMQNTAQHTQHHTTCRQGAAARHVVQTAQHASLCLCLLCCLVLAGLCTLLPGAAKASVCAATGSREVTPADVHETRMTAKAADGAFDFSSGSLDAAKECADLINRISSISLSNVAVPGMEEVLDAVRESMEEAAEETIEEACRYVAGTSSSWVRSQISTARLTANATASELAGAHVNVQRPDISDVIATHRSRFRAGLPTYADLPSLRDLQ